VASKLSRNILQSASLSGVNPSTGQYLSPTQRKAIFRRSRVSSANVFARSSSDLVPANSSAIVKYQDNSTSIKLNNVIAYFKRQEREDKKLRKRELRVQREEKVDRQRQGELLRRKEKEIGLEDGFGKKLANVLIAPVKSTAAKTQGILQQLIDFFTITFAGWLTDKGLLAIKLNAEGSTQELEKLAGEVGISLGVVGATLGILNGGLLGIAATIGGVALSVTTWLLTRPFSWARRIASASTNNRPPTTPTPSSARQGTGVQQGTGGLRGPQIGDTKTVTVNGKSFKSTVVSLEPRTGMRNGIRVQLRSRPITAAEILNNPRASAKQLEDLIRFDLSQTPGYKPGSGMTQANFRRMMSMKYGKEILKDVIIDRGTGTFRFKPNTRFSPTAETFLNRSYNPASSGFGLQQAPSIIPQSGSVASRTGLSGSSQTTPSSSIPQASKVPAGPGMVARLNQIIRSPMTWNNLLLGLKILGLALLGAELKQDWDIGDYYAIGVKIIAASAAYGVSKLGLLLAKAVFVLSGGFASAGGVLIGVGAIAAGVSTDKATREFFLTPEKRKQFGVPTREELLKKAQEAEAQAKVEANKQDIDLNALTEQEKSAMLRSAGFPALADTISPPQIQPIRSNQTNPAADVAVEPLHAHVDSIPLRRPAPEQLSEPAPNIIYRRAGGQKNQSTPLKTGSATNVPSIPSSNPDNFYTMYSQMNYNVVE